MTLAEWLPGAAGQRIGRAVLDGIDRAVEREWINAQARARSLEGTTLDDRVDALALSFARELGTVGAVTGATAAVPTLGTATAISAGAAELGWFTVRASELILTIAALHGHDSSSVEERRAWILSILIFGNGAAEAFTKLAGDAGRRLGLGAGVRLPIAAIRGINSSLGRAIITKYGRRRATVGLGTALPFGIGAIVGGSANYFGMKALAHHANRFFAKLPHAISA